ncbi:MAG: SEC-C domain-containing protein [Colwellia sp.]|nr:SEC-C domain-containing protein [Colwellia sp.]
MEIDTELKKLASEIIPLHVETLHRARLAAATPHPKTPANQNRPKVGRNAPCPCGSGKKYKKCCLT